MRSTFKIAAIMLIATMLLPVFFACGGSGKHTGVSDAERSTEQSTEQTLSPEAEQKGTVTAPEEGARIYNIIFALATVPPVLAALDSIESGYETYAVIESGKTYSGIDKLESIRNAGFDPTSNLSNGFTSAEFNSMVAKLKELREAEENSFFYIYAQDGTALRAAALAANAGIPIEDFHIYMCEDGTGAYRSISENYIDGLNASSEADEPFEAFNASLNDAALKFTIIMTKQDNKNSDPDLKYDIKSAFALSVLPNFTYWFQDKASVDGILSAAEGSRLPGIFGVEGFDNTTMLTANLRYCSISEKMSELGEEQRREYLTLMYGDYYAETEAALTCTMRSGEEVPASKLIFIGSRLAYYPSFASDAEYGIGGLGEGEAPAESYELLDERYKLPFLFGTKEDYDIFLAAIHDPASYPDNAPEDVIAEIGAACFDLYIDYIFTLKFVYSLYGGEYDLILKGHPREVLGAYSEWGERYSIKRTEGDGENAREIKYSFDKLLDRLLLSFHEHDSIGRYIGTIPYGTAAENLAYFGADIAICGLPSTTYSGYDTDIEVLFVMAETDETIEGDASQVKDRYKAGNLTYRVGGEERDAIYFNTGNTYKYAMQILHEAGEGTAAESFEARYRAWLTANRAGASDIDAQGFACDGCGYSES